MVDFMKWALTDGQKFAAELGYAPLPDGRRQARADGAGEDQAVVDGRVDARHGAGARTDLGFRVGTGVVRPRCSSLHRRRRSASSCTAQSMLSIAEVRLATSGAPTSGIRSPASSARCRSSGARSTRRFSRCSSRRRSRSASRSSSPSSCPSVAAAAAGVPDRAARRDSVDRLRPLGHLRAGAGRARARDGDARLRCGSCRSSAGRRSASACCRRRSSSPSW